MSINDEALKLANHFTNKHPEMSRMSLVNQIALNLVNKGHSPRDSQYAAITQLGECFAKETTASISFKHSTNNVIFIHRKGRDGMQAVFLDDIVFAVDHSEINYG